MNIIVTNDKSVRITQYDATDSTPIDIQNIYVHIEKETGFVPIYLQFEYKKLLDPDSLEFQVYRYRATLKMESEDKALTPNYDDYYCESAPRIIANPYRVSIIWDDSTVTEISAKGIMITNNAIADEHLPIQINDDRKIISNNHNPLLKEDSLSQMITFSIDEYYDGISFLDNTKDIYVDYIPPNFDKEAEGQGADFLSDKITFRCPDPNAMGRILLQWIVPPRITQDTGIVTYAISVINKAENYVWQSLTSTLQVLPNIGKRASSPVIPDIPDVPGDEPEDDPVTPTPDDSDLAQRVSELENFVANIDYVSGINAETGTLTQVTREDGIQTKTTHEIDDLYTNSTANNTTIITGGGAAI